TRPEEWQGRRVPDVLLGGNHAAIARWRRAQSVSLTHMHRPDLLQEARRLPTWSAADERQLEALHRPPRDTSGN
ncbi:MAG: tRNA (guanosine(37)-N1)-methyltransferase TrmD, partial [Brachymonas sp.]